MYKKTIFYLVAGYLSTWSTSQASMDRPIHMGLLFGTSLPQFSSAVFGYGIKLTHQLTNNFLFGISYYQSGVSLKINREDIVFQTEQSNAFYGGEFLFSYKGGFILGLKCGFAKARFNLYNSKGESTIEDSLNEQDFFLGPIFSYDYSLKRISVGAEINYLYTLKQPIPNSLNLLMVLKLNF